ncbi:MAG: LysM peptidoglycan-binding domain-containing protein [Cytophagaceae bacterium]
MNKLRTILLIFLAITAIASTDSFAQKKKEKKSRKEKRFKASLKKSLLATEAGNKHFENMDYYLAAKEYSKAYKFNESNGYALNRLAESYMKHFDYENAEKYYGIATETTLSNYPLARYWYALMLKGNGKYVEAQEQFEKFRKEYKSYTLEAEVYKEKAKQEAMGCELALDEMSKPQRDYEFELLKMPVNTPYSEYSPVIFQNDSIVVVTSSRVESGGKQYGMLGGGFSNVFRFKKTNKGWEAMGNEDGFDIVNSKFNESGGSFNRDFTKFYFTRCDEKVIVDNYEDYNCAIYLSRFIDGKWTKAEKLNENINMKGQWNAQPSVAPDGDILFFVSKRPGGLGMHDIWYSTSTGNEDWGPAQNMGDHVNTMFIDMSPRYYPHEKVLFFSSNGHKGFGGLDIFKIREENFYDTTDAKVINIGLPFNSNRDDFYFVMGDKKGYIASNRDGGIGNDDIYTFNLESKEALMAYVEVDSIDTETKSIAILGTVLGSEDKKPAPDIGVSLTDESSVKIKTTSTDDEGKFRFDNLPTDKNYKVLLDDNSPKLTTEIKYVVKDLHVNKSSQEARKTLFENIYFDFDSHLIRPEAKKTLDELITFYKKHPEIQIEMNANTDAIGSGDYNKALSEKRGKAAREYLISKGIPKSAIVINALGMDKPIATNDNPIGRQLNRRVEFSIIGGPGYEAKTMAYVIEPKSTIDKVAKKFNMTVEELKELNALQDDYLKSYTTLRVRRTEDADLIAPISMNVISKTTLEKIRQKSETLSNEPSENVYVVEPKNTMFSIARLYGLTVEELQKMNYLETTYLIVGQHLRVKTGNVPEEAILSGKLHLVVKGESLESIAQKYGLTKEELVEINAMEFYRLQPNMVIRVKKKN